MKRERILRLERWLGNMDREIEFLNQIKNGMRERKTLTKAEEVQIKIYDRRSRLVLKYYQNKRVKYAR